MNMNVENYIGEKKLISLRLNVSLVEEVNKIADTLSISMTDFIRKAIEKEVKEINNDFYKFSLNKIEKKSTFASALLYFDEEENDMEWKVPRYIKEGLLWIQEF